MPNITTRETSAEILVYSPYNTSFVARAKKLGATWDKAKSAWAFPVHVKAHISPLLIDCYGEDGSTPPEYVTLRVTWPTGESNDKGPIEYAGRSIAHAYGRDSGAKLGDRVAILKGSVSSGGSVKNWTTTISAGAVVEIYEVPRALAESCAAKDSDCEIIEPPIPANNEDAISRLKAERDTITARLKVIDDEIASLSAKPNRMLDESLSIAA